MKTPIVKTRIVSAIAVSAAMLAVAGVPGLAQAQQVRIENAVARVVVIVEDRADVAVSVERGSTRLPALSVNRRGDRIEVRGNLPRNAVRSCRSAPAGRDHPGNGAVVEVRDHGRIAVAEAPLIVIRSPRDVDVSASGAVYGAVGRGARDVELANGGCGNWTVADVAGPLTVSVGGSGDVRAGTSRVLTVSVAGSGDVIAGASGNATISVAGSGDVHLAGVNGDFSASIAGSGDIRAAGGEARRFSVSIAGSGDVDFRGTARDADVSIVGSGDVRVRAVSGQTRRNVIGSGRLRVGG